MITLYSHTKCDHSVGQNIDIVRPIDAQKPLDGCSYASSQLSVVQGPGGPSCGEGVGDGWWVVGHVAIIVATSLLLPTESTIDDLPLPSLPFAGSAEAIRRRHLRLPVSAGHNGEGGVVGVRHRGGKAKGGEGSFWGMCGGV